MLRNIIRQFSTKIKLTPIITIQQVPFQCNNVNNINVKSICSKIQTEINKISTKNDNNFEKNPFDTEDYVLLQQNDKNQKLYTIVNKSTISEELSAKYRLSDKQIEKIFKDDLKLKRHNTTKDFSKVVDILLQYGISKDSIITNPWILTMNSRLLQHKLESINTIKCRDPNDFVKFLKLSTTRLQRLMLFLRKDAELIPIAENRFYYISDKLKLDPKIVANYLSKRLFMLQIPFNTLQVNLNYMIQYGVKPLSILKDLWAFRYTPKSVKARLERAKIAKKDKIMPWMIRCPERILQKSLKLSLDEKKLLGDKNSIVDYVASRLGYDVVTTQAIMIKHPAVLRVRAPKVKEVLDYLLDNAKIEPYEIAQVPRIMCHGLETTKKRFEELKSYGCKPSSLVIVCRSRREYEKFLRNWIELKEKSYKYKSKQIITDSEQV